MSICRLFVAKRLCISCYPARCCIVDVCFCSRCGTNEECGVQANSGAFPLQLGKCGEYPLIYLYIRTHTNKIDQSIGQLHQLANFWRVRCACNIFGHLVCGCGSVCWSVRACLLRHRNTVVHVALRCGCQVVSSTFFYRNKFGDFLRSV